MQLSMAEFFECFLVLQLNLSTTKFKMPETNMFSYYVTSGRGTSVNFGDVCTSKGLKTWTYLRMKLMKIGTPSKADTLEITLCSRKKVKKSMNVATLFRLYGPVHTNPFSNENGAVLLRIRQSFTLQHRKRSPKTEPFENALQSGAIWKRCVLKRCFLVWTRKRCYLKTVTSSK